ncbi:ABC transporter permease [Burkholderia sp. MR1-5-21]
MDLVSLIRLFSPFPPGWGGMLLSGAATTLAIAFGGYITGTVIGLLGAMGKLHGGRAVRFCFDSYTVIVRAVPELVLIVSLFYAGTDGLNELLALFGLPPADLNGFAAAIIVLGIVQGAYATEVIRGAILAIPAGQIEAAKACGMPAWTRFRRITFPSMVPNALPGLANQWMSITKNTALIAVVGYQELSLATLVAAGSTKHYFAFFLVSGAIYLAITLVSNVIFSRLDKRFRVGQRRS